VEALLEGKKSKGEGKTVGTKKAELARDKKWDSYFKLVETYDMSVCRKF
jgi:hypothetical protein